MGETGNGFEAVQIIERLQPNIAMLDLMIEGINGIEVAKRLNHSTCHTSVSFFPCWAVSLSPNDGPVGTLVDITGSGFTPSDKGGTGIYQRWTS